MQLKVSKYPMHKKETHTHTHTHTHRNPLIYFVYSLSSVIYSAFLLLLSVGLPLANAPDVLQPYGLLYYP